MCKNCKFCFPFEIKKLGIKISGYQCEYLDKTVNPTGNGCPEFTGKAIKNEFKTFNL